MKMRILLICLLTVLVIQPADSLRADTGPARIALLSAGWDTPNRLAIWRAFSKRLQELGYVEGRHVVFVRRWSRGARDKLDDYANELVALRPDAIVTFATPAVVAAKRATSTIPIVMGVVSNPVENGLVDGLARPGGNVTGMAVLTTEIAVKRFELMREIMPTASRMAILGAETHPNFAPAVRATRAVARRLGVTLQVVGIRAVGEIDGAFARMSAARAEAVIIVPGPVVNSTLARIARLAAKASLPATHPAPIFAARGGLMSYGTDLRYSMRRAANYVDKILRGAKPSALPVEQVPVNNLVINLKAAKALGITVPRAILLRATDLIE